VRLVTRPLRRLTVTGAAIAVLAALAPAAAGASEAPSVTITYPHSGSVISDPTPTFTGTTQGVAWEEQVVVYIYAGEHSEDLVEELSSSESNSWSARPSAALTAGTYTAIAEVPDPCLLCAPARSAPITFTIDTTPPRVTLEYPPNGSSSIGETALVGGVAGTEPLDLPEITVQLFSGPSVAGDPLEAASVQANSGGYWSATFGGLAPGTYTARALQTDRAGNLGVSSISTFTLRAPAVSPPTPPLASFLWIPSAPYVGEQVTLVSSSTDLSAPITTLAWSVPPSEQPTATGPVWTTSFSKPGAHLVRLRAIDANGLSSTASETVFVSPAPVSLMAPFPIVRIVGRETSTGVLISLLSVQSPVGARVTVSCRGHGCPARSVSLLARAGRTHTGTATVSFRRFARRLRAGVVLEIRVTQAGTIGKYTRFAIRRHQLPSRYDACLTPESVRPVSCP
jgi:hypothetical protein